MWLSEIIPGINTVYLRTMITCFFLLYNELINKAEMERKCTFLQILQNKPDRQSGRSIDKVSNDTKNNAFWKLIHNNDNQHF